MKRLVLVACAVGAALGMSIVSADVPRKVLTVNGKCPHRYVLKNDVECAPSELCRDHSMPRMDGSCPEDTPEVQNNSCVTTFDDGAPVAAGATSGGCMGSSSKAPRRRLFAANGRLVDILHKYVDEAERRKIPLALDTLSIHYFDKNNQQKTMTLPAKPGWAVIFSDTTPLKRWEKLLGDEVALPREDAKSDAHVLQADVVCGD